MRLLIAGKFIQIDSFVELVSESPLINNFDTQYAQYSNSFEVKYSGEVVELFDISKLRITASPYLTIDGHLIDGEILIPVTIIITAFDPNKNTIKMNVSERFPSIVSGGIDIRTTKLTELRHTVNPLFYEGFTDEIILPNGSVDDSYLGEASVLADDPDNYPHFVTPNNWCPLVSVLKLATFLNDRYGILVEDAPDTNFFANRQLPFAGDLVKGVVAELPIWTELETADFSINNASVGVFPAGIDSTGYLPAGTSDKLVKYTNKIGDSNGWLISCVVKVSPFGDLPTPFDFEVSFKGVPLDFIGVDETGYLLTYGLVDKTTELDLYIKTSGTNFHVANFVVNNLMAQPYKFYANCRFNLTIPDNTAQAMPYNTRQIFQNMPDVTIVDFFRAIAKASAKYLEITETGFKFVDIASSLTKESIVDASPYFIGASNVAYTLYDSPALEYWYKDAKTATLIVPIADSRVKSTAKKIEIGMLRTDDANVSLFEEDGIKPLSGIATYPFLDITDQAAELVTFYSAIQNPFVVTATFRNFNLNLSNSILIRQLNGLFVPKKIIKTNRDIIELELLKLEPASTASGLIITENSAFALITEDGIYYIAQEGT